MYVATQYIGGAGRTRYQFIGAAHNLPANQDPQSQVLNWGDEPRAGETRDLIIGIAFHTSSGVEPDTLTVDGNAAVRITGHAPAGVFTVGQAFWRIRQQAGTSGAIAFGVPSGDIDGGMIAVWAAYNLKSTTPTDTTAFAAAAGGVSDISVDVLQGGAVFAVTAAALGATASADWVGVTEDSAYEATASNMSWAASALNAAAATPRTVQVSRQFGGNPVTMSALAVSFR